MPVEMRVSMPKPSHRLKQLEHELLALGDEAMLLEEFDGFVAGLLVCPELIKPGEWLPVVWGTEEDGEPAFDSIDHLNRVLGLLMEHYNDVAVTLIERPERYAPLFAVNLRNNDILWEIWIVGFEKAVKLRPAAWRELLDADAETARAFSGLLTLADVDRRDPQFSDEQLDALTAAAPRADWPLAGHAQSMAPGQPPADAGVLAATVVRLTSFWQGWTQRSMSLRVGQEIQEMLRLELNRGYRSTLTEIKPGSARQDATV